ncbi:MAG: dihydroxy-acid dehydratase [Promethearchaeota archaeon]
MNKPEIDIKKRSKSIFEPIKNTPNYYGPYGVWKGVGLEEKEIDKKPLIAIVNTWNDFNPGHEHLRALAEGVRWGIIEAGGIPMEFNTIAPCDGIAQGNEGMKFILLQRDLIADSIEAMLEAHRLDAMVTLSSCDKINPAVLMAAARLNIPTICVPGGPGMMEIEFSPHYRGLYHHDYDRPNDIFACHTCATPGACGYMGTANSIQCLTEALGMTMPNAATAPAIGKIKYIIAKHSGRQIIELLKKDIKPLDILTQEAFENAIMVDMAIGGSTNVVLHLPAIAQEAGIDLDLDLFNKFSKLIPTIANVQPNGVFSITDLYKAGGIPTIMKRIEKFLHLNCLTVSGKTWKQLLRRIKFQEENIIRPLTNPIFPEGGTVILKGNIAPHGAVIKQSGIKDKNMLKLTGKAIVFDSHYEAVQALGQNKIKNGHVVVIRYEGPKGAPGMPENQAFGEMLNLRKDITEVAMITDGRFSGATFGPVIGHVSPEAYVGGPIAIIKNGDTIMIDIPNRKVNADLSDDEIKKRFENWKPVEHEVKSKVLRRYRMLVSSADKGAVLKS